MRRNTARHLDKTLALFDVKRLTYKFQALDSSVKEEGRALEIMRVMQQYARDSGHEIKEGCISFVYETCGWLWRCTGSGDFVSHQTSILLECLPIGVGGLRAASKQSLRKHELELLKHGINVAGEIAYAVCKYIRAKEPAEHAIAMLHDVLRFSVLNGLTACEKQALREFAECERISAQPLREGHAFDVGLQLLSEYKQAAIDR